jgi:serine/threonine protein kinase
MQISYQGAQNFRFFKKLGEGAVGEVYQVAHKQTNEIFAIKRVNKHLAKIVSTTFHNFISRHKTMKDSISTKHHF